MPDTTIYITVDELKQRMNISDNATDAALLSVITAASRQVDGYTGRFFGKLGVDAPITKRFIASEPTILRISDAVSVASVAADLYGTRTFTGVFDPADYELAPYGASVSNEPYTRIEFFPPTLSTTYALQVGPSYSVAVAGVWGWPAIPDPVVQATALQAHRLWTRQSAPFGVSGSNEMGQVRALTKIDPDLELLLNQYVPLVI